MLGKLSYSLKYVEIILFVFMICFAYGGKTANAQEIISLQGELAGFQDVLLTWENRSNDYTYQIERSEGGNSNFSLIATVAGQEKKISYHDKNVKLGKDYYYKVIRTAADQNREESNEVMVKITLCSPENTKVKRKNNSEAQLTWNEVKKAASYVIYRSKQKESGFKKIGTTTQTNYIDKAVKSGAVYYYKVLARRKKNPAADSPYGDTVAVYMKPAAPKADGMYVKKKIKITWKKITGADLYYVYKKNGEGIFEKTGETKKLYYKDADVQKGKSYDYKIMAVYSKDGKTVKSKFGKVCTVLASEIDPNKKMVALTFDDGPGQYTADIVKYLKKHNARATFFVLGCNVDKYKSAVKAADKIGCEIANHSYSHSNLANLSASKMEQEISKTDKKIKKVIGKESEIMRPPYGSVNSTVKKSVGKPLIMWSIDTLDWKHRNADKTVKTVMDNVKDGDIILMHDIHEPTKRAAITLIGKLQDKGYQLVTVSELAKYRKISLKKGKTYRNLRK